MAEMMALHSCHLPLKGGPHSSSKQVKNNSTECSKPSTEDKKSSTEDKKSSTVDEVKTTSDRVNIGIEISNHPNPKEKTKDLEINTYKEVMLNEPNKNKDQTPMEEWSILSDHVKYVMHDKSEAFHKLSIDSMNYRQNKDLYKSLNNEQSIKANQNFGKSPEN